MNQHSIEFIIDAQNKTKAQFNEVKNGLSSLSDKAKEMESTFKRMSTVGIGSATALIVGIQKLGKQGAEFESVKNDYTRMANSMGWDSDKLIDKLNKVSGETVSNTDLMLSVNKAMALGVGKNMEDITKLMEIARVKGRALGLDTTQAFNDIVTGIGRNSPLILDNLGIITKGWNEEAEATGKAFDSQFILNKILQQGTEELKAIGEVQLSSSERLQVLNKQIKDMGDNLGVILIPIIQNVIERISPLIERVTNWAKENPELARTIVLVTTATLLFIGAVGLLGLAIARLNTILWANPLVWVIALITATLVAFVMLGNYVKVFADNWKTVVYIMKSNWDSLVTKIKTGVQMMKEIWWTFITGFTNMWLSAINWVIRGLNKIQITMPDWLGGKSFGINIQELEKVSIDDFKIADEYLKGDTIVNINGGTYLSEDVAEDIGDKIIDKLKLNMKV